jgi:hypothetical protein
MNSKVGDVHYTYVNEPYKMSNIPGIKHKVIGLVSGGKDSTFNLLHCVANGHELVALATLTPEAGIGMSYR